MEALRALEVPQIYQKRRTAAEAFKLAQKGELEHTPSDLEKLQNIKSILDSEQLLRLVHEGKIELGAVKANASAGKGDGGLPKTDESAANALLGEIGREKIPFSFSVQLTREQVEEFYAPNKERHSGILDEATGLTVWDTVVNQASSGPVTFFLIYHDGNDGLNAVEWWRKKMGATDPHKAEEGTIRAKYARNILLPNNLVHGSDSIESAEREIGVLSKVVGSQTKSLTSSAR